MHHPKSAINVIEKMNLLQAGRVDALANLRVNIVPFPADARPNESVKRADQISEFLQIQSTLPTEVDGFIFGKLIIALLLREKTPRTFRRSCVMTVSARTLRQHFPHVVSHSRSINSTAF